MVAGQFLCLLLLCTFSPRLSYFKTLFEHKLLYCPEGYYICPQLNLQIIFIGNKYPSVTLLFLWSIILAFNFFFPPLDVLKISISIGVFVFHKRARWIKNSKQKSLGKIALKMPFIAKSNFVTLWSDWWWI